MRPLFHFALESGPALFLPGERHPSQGGESHETEPEGQVHGVAGGGGEGLAAEVALAVLIGVRMARGREETGLGFTAGAGTDPFPIGSAGHFLCHDPFAELVIVTAAP